MRPEELLFAENKREEIYEMRPDYPYAVRRFDVDLSGTMIAPWHWHEEMELLLVKADGLNYDMMGECLMLKKGDVLFVNSNTLHQVYASDAGKHIRYDVHMFRGSLIADPDSLIEKNYVRPLQQMQTAKWILLKNGEADHWKVLKCLEQLSELEQKRSYGYELYSRNLLSEILLYLLDRKRNETKNESRETVGREMENEMRLRKMLLYIQEYYGEHLSLADLAKAANIGERECLRCFQKTLHTSPFRYLQEYRIQAASNRLKNSELKIVDIALQCGFSSASYFGKVFHREMGCTLQEYRKQKSI